MNSNYGRSTKSSSLDFDLGIGSNRSRSLNDQKNKTSSYASPFTSTQPKPNSSATSPCQPRPAWTHQPAPTQSARPGLPGAPTSMVGDIHGKSWASSGAAPSVAAPSIGIVNKNPNLFGDLVNSALGQNKGNNNVPLKNVTPVFSQGSSYKGLNSMGKMADSLPKTGSSVKSVNGGGWGSSESFGSFTSASKSNNNNSNVKSTNIGGSSMKSGIGGGMSSMKDPFGVLLDFSTKKEANLNSAAKGTSSKPVASGNDSFGDFQNAAKSSKPSHTADPFANFSHNFSGSKSGSYTNVDDFAIPTQTQPPVQSSGANVFDSLFASSAAASGGSAFKGSDDGLGNQQFSGGDDWGTDPGFGGGNDSGGTTTELEGLPPPPSGVSASTAKNKGMDNYKQGQYPDAIKWLSWAVVLLEKSGNVAATMEVLSSRASCYKEVGEYKKAVADCTKVLEHDGENVGVLVQRALLYESMEKYKLGADDLRAVMKIDPGNRVARSTVHRLTKMAG